MPGLHSMSHRKGIRYLSKYVFNTRNRWKTLDRMCLLYLLWQSRHTVLPHTL